MPIPLEQPKTEEDKKADSDEKKLDCNKCKEDKCEDCISVDQKIDKDDKEDDSKKTLSGRKLRKPRKNRKSINKQELGQCFFPMSMSIMFGPLRDSKSDVINMGFPYNVTFKQVSN